MLDSSEFKSDRLLEELTKKITGVQILLEQYKQAKAEELASIREDLRPLVELSREITASIHSK